MAPLEKIEKIVRTTQKNPILGFLMATLIAISVLGGVISYLYLDGKKVSRERLDSLQQCTVENKRLRDEYAAKTEAFLTARIKRMEAKEQQMDSLIFITQKALKNVKN